MRGNFVWKTRRRGRNRKEIKNRAHRRSTEIELTCYAERRNLVVQKQGVCFMCINNESLVRELFFTSLTRFHIYVYIELGKKQRDYTFIPTSLFRDYSLIKGFYIYIGSLCIDFSVSQCSIRRSKARYMLQ